MLRIAGGRLVSSIRQVHNLLDPALMYWRVRGAAGGRGWSLIDEAAMVQRILRHLGLPTEVPQLIEKGPSISL